MKTIAILDQYRTGVQSSSGVQFETGPVPYLHKFPRERERKKKQFLRPLAMLAVKKPNLAHFPPTHIEFDCLFLFIMLVQKARVAARMFAE